ncbi:MAG TPA: hypothetical protein VFW80_02675 [Gaiellaceae bacterium]|nr:hypothetical protein [Gaiellaceae bacterium]
MARKLRRRTAVGAAAVLALAGGGGAVAATQLSPQERNQGVLDAAAKELGVTPGELSSALHNALEKRIDEAVAAGRLTKAQGEALKQRIESRPSAPPVRARTGPFGGRHGCHHPPFFRGTGT